MEKKEEDRLSIHGTPLTQWTIEEVTQWFATERGGKWAKYYTDHFEEYDGEDLSLLTQDDFIQELGRNAGIRLYNAVSKVKKRGTPRYIKPLPPFQ